MATPPHASPPPLCTDDSSNDGGNYLNLFHALSKVELNAFRSLEQCIENGESHEETKRCQDILMEAMQKRVEMEEQAVMEEQEVDIPTFLKKKMRKNSRLFDKLDSQQRKIERSRRSIVKHIGEAVATLKREAELTRLHMARDSAQRAQEHKALKGIVSNNNATGHEALRLLQMIALRMDINPSDAVTTEVAAGEGEAQKIPTFMGPPGSKVPPNDVANPTQPALHVAEPPVASAKPSADVVIKVNQHSDAAGIDANQTAEAGHSIKPEKSFFPRSGDDAPSPSAKASKPPLKVPTAPKSKIGPPLKNTTMPLESIGKLNGSSSDLNRKGEAKSVLAGTDSRSTAPSIVAAAVASTVPGPKTNMPQIDSEQATGDGSSKASPAYRHSEAEAESSVVQPPASKEEAIASIRRKIDKPKASGDSAMAEMVNKKSKSALRLRQDSFKSSSRPVAKPGPLSALADTSNKPGISVKQRKQAIIQPRENKAALLRAKKNREKVAEQNLKERLEEMRKKKEQQRKEKEIERNVDQRWCSGV